MKTQFDNNFRMGMLEKNRRFVRLSSQEVWNDRLRQIHL